MTVPPTTTPQNITTPNDADPFLIKTQERLQALVADALITGGLDLSNCTIEVDFNLGNLLEKCGATRTKNERRYHPFNARIDCTFSINFRGTVFAKSANFLFTTFHRCADFISTTFIESAYFIGTIFVNSGDFNSTTFIKTADFQDATFISSAYFSGATFTQSVSFVETTFTQSVSFVETTFTESIDFTKTNFNDNINFNIITLKKSIKLKILSNAQLKYIRIQEATLEENSCIIVDYGNNKNSTTLLNISNMECDSNTVQLKIKNLPKNTSDQNFNNTLITFKDCHFYGKNVAFNNVAMQNVSVTGGNTVNGMLFNHCHFVETVVPKLPFLRFKALGNEQQYFHPTKEDSKQTWADRALVYANLKSTATTAGETQLANHFYFWQLYYQGKIQASPWNTLYKYSSAYGQSVLLPSVLLLVTWFVFSLIYYYVSDFCIADSAIISLFSSLPLFGGKDTILHLYNNKAMYEAALKTWYFWSFYGWQSLLQSFLVFQIGAAIRNQVKK